VPHSQTHGSGATAHVAHQFEDSAQQFFAATFGMWLFLATEIMFFGGLFTAYVYYRTLYHVAFVHGSNHLDVTLGTINTAVLIGSSFTMVLAVHAAQTGRIRRIFSALLATMTLGAVFLVIKAFEYHHKYIDGLVPGPLWSYQAPDAHHQELFMSLYFAMTGLHATHMIIGIGVLAWLAVQAHRGKYDAHYYNPIECAGLYWHFVDIVWIFLFPLLYLIGRS
jgi:cytochrome c oxidase subunit 3